MKKQFPMFLRIQIFVIRNISNSNLRCITTVCVDNERHVYLGNNKGLFLSLELQKMHLLLYNPASAFLKEKRALTCGLGVGFKSARCNFKNYQFRVVVLIFSHKLTS